VVRWFSGDDLRGKEKSQQQQPAAGIQAAAGMGASISGTHDQHPSILHGESDGVTLADGTSDGALLFEDQHLGAALDTMVNVEVSADGEPNNVLGSVMTMAVLSDGELTPVRRSKRNADMADVHSLEKAEKRVAIKNLEAPQGNENTLINSVCSFSSDRIKKNLQGVGICLGGKENLIAGSVALIKDVEKERLKPLYVVNSPDKEIESEEDEINPDTTTISRLCGNLMEEVMGDNSVGLDRVLVDIPIKVAKIESQRKSSIGGCLQRQNCSNERDLLEL
jgi:hypothetical protein